jgi:hypothetical protein
VCEWVAREGGVNLSENGETESPGLGFQARCTGGLVVG